MKGHGSILRWLGVGIILVALVASAVGLVIVERNTAELRASAKENLLWSAQRLEVELLRFEKTLAEFVADTGVSPRAVNKRFDILWSRTDLLRHGDVGKRIKAYDPEGQAIDALFRALQTHEQEIVNLAPDDKATGRRLLEAFTPFEAQLRRLSRDVLHGEEARMSAIREKLLRSARINTVLNLVIGIASAMTLVLFWRESNRMRRLAMQNERLLRAAEAVSEAKSRFLTMMSHELRTPMNGVLGFLSLIERDRLPKASRQFLELAEVSAKSMSTLLADILDFSALQDERLEIETGPFSPAELAEMLASILAPTHDEGNPPSITIRLAPDMPDRICGDESRIRQVFTHIIRYLADTAGTRDLVLDLEWIEGRLRGIVSFSYQGSRSSWRPDFILGEPDEASARESGRERFASDALGPAIARTLVAHMGGAITYKDDGDRNFIVVEIPTDTACLEESPSTRNDCAGTTAAQPPSAPPPLGPKDGSFETNCSERFTGALVLSHTGFLKTLLEGALEKSGVRLMKEPGPELDLVLVETGFPALKEKARIIKRNYPHVAIATFSSNPPEDRLPSHDRVAFHLSLPATPEDIAELMNALKLGKKRVSVM